MTPEELCNYNAFNGLLYVSSLRRFVQEQIAQHIAIYGYQPALGEMD